MVINMAEKEIPQQITDLKDLCKEVLNDQELKSWLFKHTKSESEYNALRRCLYSMNNFTPVTWSGNSGHRFYLPLEV